jgi:hypothetical protein
MQKYFDSCAGLEQSDLKMFHLDNGLDISNFKGEAITFKETSLGLSTVDFVLIQF